MMKVLQDGMHLNIMYNNQWRFFGHGL